MTTPKFATLDPDGGAPCGCRIRMSVEQRLERSGYAALSLVCCEYQGESGTLHLRGSVPSYFLKQVAQELAHDVDGVRFVINQISVARSTGSAAAHHQNAGE
jgi:osmotically-inducible protein OsmY